MLRRLVGKDPNVFLPWDFLYAFPEVESSVVFVNETKERLVDRCSCWSDYIADMLRNIFSKLHSNHFDV